MRNIINPVILKVYLYSHNYVDRLLIAELRDHFFKDDAGAQYVRADVLANVVRGKFRPHLEEIRNMPGEQLPSRVTSVFFLDQILTEYQKLKYLHVQVLDDEQYSRSIKDDVNFDYRIVYSKVDLSFALEPSFFREVRGAFKDIGLYDHTLPEYDRPAYFEVYTSDMISRLEQYRQGEPQEGNRWNLVEGIMSFFGTKLQADDSRLLIVMEN